MTAASRAAPGQPVPGQPAQQHPDVVVMRDVSHDFGKLRVLHGITLSIPSGTILGVIGPSGSGKTTTIRTLTGALTPTVGEVRVLGEEPRHFRRRTRERIGYMPQQFVLYPDLTVRENVSFVGALFGMLWRRRRRRVSAVLELVELSDVSSRRASDLSGGMQRRLELACALVHDPTLMFLDEPTAGIDPILRQTIWTELRRLRNEGRTLLVTTQYVGEAEYCDRVALISQGQLIALATPEELRKEALGGQVLELETAAPFDGRVLTGIRGLVQVRQRGPRDILVVAHDIGAAAPRITDAIQDAGGVVTSSREYHPSFDEVFAELVQRHAALPGAASPDGGAGGATEIRADT